MLSEEVKDILNDFYETYHEKCSKLSKLLSKNYKVNYYYTNNYYNTNIYDYYPLPVIEVKDVCDIVFLNENEVNVVCKLSKNKAINLDYKKLKNLDYSIYPTSDLYDDLYIKGMSEKELKDNIKNCKDKEIGFIFIIPFDMSNSNINKLVNKLKELSFYN